MFLKLLEEKKRDGQCDYLRAPYKDYVRSVIYVSIFLDNEEKLYWNKIEQDRKEKLHDKKRFKQRGRDKLLKRAEKELGKCIKFDQV